MDRFTATNFAPVEYDGLLVHPMLRLKVAVQDRLQLQWVSAHSPRVQGLSLRLRRPGVPGAKGRGGLLRADDAEVPTIVLWMDTAPVSVEVRCVQVTDGAELQVSNRWRMDDGTEHEWLNNFGIVIESRGPTSYLLRCSDGYGAPSFEDLIVRVEHIPAVASSA